MENVRKHRDTKLVATNKRRNQLVSEPNYHAARWFSENLMYEFWYDYIKPKYGKNSFIIHIKTKDFYKDIATSNTFDTSNYEVNRPLPKGKKFKKMIGLMKDELGGKIMIEFVALRPKTYSYLMDDDSEVKKAKGTKKCVIKRMFMIMLMNDYKDCLLNDEIILKSQQRFKSEAHDVYTEEINKTALSSNDGERLQTFDRIITYLYGYKH